LLFSFCGESGCAPDDGNDVFEKSAVELNWLDLLADGLEVEAVRVDNPLDNKGASLRLLALLEVAFRLVLAVVRVCVLVAFISCSVDAIKVGEWVREC
jgi:hypothetical protein